jgi:uncharacterized protein YjgD (DUF1641 family)
MDLKKHCLKKNIDYNLVKIVKLIFDTGEVELIDTLFSSLFDSNVANLLRIELTEDVDGELKLKSPYNEINAVENTTSLFNKYYKYLLDNQLTTRGHVDNLGSAAIVTKNKETENSFFNLMNQFKDFDMDRLVKVTVEYYKEVEYKTKLNKYLDNSAYGDYLGYKEKKKNYDEY